MASFAGIQHTTNKEPIALIAAIASDTTTTEDQAVRAVIIVTGTRPPVAAVAHICQAAVEEVP